MRRIPSSFLPYLHQIPLSSCFLIIVCFLSSRCLPPSLPSSLQLKSKSPRPSTRPKNVSSKSPKPSSISVKKNTKYPVKSSNHTRRHTKYLVPSSTKPPKLSKSPGPSSIKKPSNPNLWSHNDLSPSPTLSWYPKLSPKPKWYKIPDIHFKYYRQL